MGANQHVEEIQLESFTLMVKKLDSYSFVLITELSTQFFKETLDNLSFHINSELKDVIPELGLNKEKLYNFNSMIETHFGIKKRV